jgi:hypothetical protein
MEYQQSAVEQRQNNDACCASWIVEMHITSEIVE